MALKILIVGGEGLRISTNLFLPQSTEMVAGKANSHQKNKLKLLCKFLRDDNLKHINYINWDQQIVVLILLNFGLLFLCISQMNQFCESNFLKLKLAEKISLAVCPLTVCRLVCANEILR